MIRTEIEISVNVGGLSVDFGVQCRLLPDDENVQAGIALSYSISMVNWMVCLKILRRLR
jgi:hypothetical protein